MSKMEYAFRGVIAAVMTPFHSKKPKTLNLEIIPKYAEYLSKNGIQGVLVAGTSGEGMSMSVNERKLLTEAWAKAVTVTKQHLMVQIGGAPLPDVLELAKHANSQVSVGSILVLPELYFKPNSAAELINYLKLINEVAPDTPLLYYHIPAFTNVNVKMGEFLESIGNQIPSFVGIKYSSGDLEDGGQALYADHKKYVIFLGCDQAMVPGFAMGIDSFIVAGANFFPKLMTETHEMLKSGNFQKAKEQQELLTKAISTIKKYGAWVPTIKSAMTLLTEVDVGHPRDPLQTLSAEMANMMAADLKKLGFSTKV